MFNNINSNGSGLLFGSSQQLGNASNVINLNSIRSNLQKNGYINSSYVDKSEISSDAMKLFLKDIDIKKFTQIMMSDSDDNSYLERMKDLFKSGVVDVGEDDVMPELVNNKKLWDDLLS